MNPNTYQDLGLDVKPPDKFDANDGQHMYGDVEGPMSLFSVDELGIYAQTRDDGGKKYSIYDGLNSGANKTSFLPGSALHQDTISQQSDTMERPVVVAADLDGIGQKNCTVMMKTGPSGQVYLSMQKVDPKTGVKTGFRDVATIMDADFLNYKDTNNERKNIQKEGGIKAWMAEGTYQIVAGNFDREAGDEIAIYIPTLWSGSPEVRIYKWNGSQLTQWKSLWLTAYKDNGQKSDTDHAVRALPSVSLTAGDINKDGYDELMVAASGSNFETASNSGSYPRFDQPSNLYLLDKKFFDNDAPFPLPEADRTFNLEIGGQEAYSDQAAEKNQTTYKMSFQMCQVGTAVGDVNGDNLPDLVVAGRFGYVRGTKNKDIYEDRYMMNYLSYDLATDTYKWADDWYSFQKTGDIYMPYNVGNDWLQMMNPVTLACVNIDGTAEYKGEVVCVEGQLLRWGQSGAQDFPQGAVYPKLKDNIRGGFAPLDSASVEGSQVYLDTNNDSLKWINQMIVGNFDGNPQGKEQLIYVYGKKTSGALSGNTYYYDIGLYGGTTNGNIETPQIFGQSNVENGASVSVCAPNVDDDSMIIRYKKKDYSFSNPQVIAVLVSPPYFEDLSSLGEYGFQTNSYTQFGQSSGGGSSQGVGASINAGIVGKVEADIDLIVIKAVSLDYEMSLMASFSYEHVWNAQRVDTMSFQTLGGTDSVALAAYPITNYYYDAFYPAHTITQQDIKDNGGQPIVQDGVAYNVGDTIPEGTRELVISEPGSIYKSVIDVDQYDEIANKTAGMQPIRGNLITSTPGDPYTYKRGFGSDIYEEYAMKPDDGIRSTNSGNSAASFSIEIENSEENNFTIGAETSHTMLAGGADIKVGGRLEMGASYSYGSVSIAGQSFEASVVNMPKEAEGYWFKWLFGVRKARLNGSDVMVLDYAIPEMCTIPRTVMNLKAEAKSSHEIELVWEVPGHNKAYALGGYDIYARDELFQTWQRIGHVEDGVTSFTHKDLDPNMLYEYKIKSRGKGADVSTFSETVSARTLFDGDGPEIVTQPTDQLGYAGYEATFQVEAKGVNESGFSRLYYQWYTLSKGSNGWMERTPIENANNATLTLQNLKLHQDGVQLYCDVTQFTPNKTPMTLRSNVVTLRVGRKPADIALTLDKEAGKAVSFDGGTPVRLQAGVTANGGNLTGEVAFTVTSMENGVVQYQETKTLSSGTAACSWTAPMAGVYEVTAKYLGDDNGIFQPVVSAPQYYTALSNGNQDTYTLVGLPKTIEYGDKGEFYVQRTYMDKGNLKTERVEDYSCVSDGLTIKRKAGNIHVYEANKKVGNFALLYTIHEPGTGVPMLDLTYGYTVAAKPISVSTEEMSIVKGDTVTPDAFTPVVSPAPLDKDIQCFENDSFHFNSGVSPYSQPGRYLVDIAVKGGTPAQEQLKNYDINFEPGVVNVEERTYQITFEAGVNGAVSAKRLTPDGRSYGLTSGEPVVEGYPVEFTAVPTDHYAVEQWTVNGNVVQNQDGSVNRSSTYQVDNLNQDVDVTVTFTPAYWQVDYSVASSGQQPNGSLTASYKGEPMASGARVAGGEAVTFTAVPDEGFMVAEWQLNGKRIEGHYDSQLILPELKADSNVTVRFAPKQSFTVAYQTVGAGTGTVSATLNTSATPVASGDTVPYGSSVTLTAVPGEHSMVKEWRVNGKAVAGNQQTLVVSDITANQSIDVELVETISFQVIFDAGSGGQISAAKENRPIASGSNVEAYSKLQFTAEPEPGKMVDGWTINGEAVEGHYSRYLDIDSLTENTRVAVTFADETNYNFDYGVISTVGNEGYNGTLTVAYTEPDQPEQTLAATTNGQQSLRKGASIKVEATPAEGYAVKQWLLDGAVYTVQGEPYTGTTLEVGPLLADKRVEVQFEQAANYFVTYAADGAGSLSATLNGEKAESNVYLAPGAELVLTAQPDAGYQLVRWEVNGTPVTDGNGLVTDLTYSYKAVGAADIKAVFRGEPIAVTVTAESGGTAAVTSVHDGPNGAPRRGDAVEVTAIPDVGYGVTAWQVNGEAVSGATGNTYSFTLDDTVIQAGAVTVAVSFEQKSYTLAYDSSADGSLEVTVDGEPAESGKQYPGGVQVEMTASPDEGYRTTWLLNGVPVNDNNNAYGFKLAADTEIQVTFEAVPQHEVTVFINGEGSYTAFADGVELTPTGDMVQVAAGAELVITAQPNLMHRVKAWTIDGSKEETHDITRKLRVNQDMEVEIEFESVGNYEVSYAPADPNDGSLEGYVNTDGPEATGYGDAFVSDTQLPAAARLTFVAAPVAGKMVDYWLVNGKEYKDADGYVWVDNVLEIPALSEPLEVVVVMTDYVGYAVTFEGVNGTVEATTGGQAIASGDEVRAGAKISFTAQPDEGYALSQWEDSTGSGSAAKGKPLSYVISKLEGPAEITAVFAPGYGVTFTQPNGGTLAAVVEGNAIGSGDLVAAGKDVVFTFTPNNRYQLSNWYIDGVRQTETGNTLTVPDLAADLNVSVKTSYQGGSPGGSGGSSSAAKGEYSIGVGGKEMIGKGFLLPLGDTAELVLYLDGKPITSGVTWSLDTTGVLTLADGKVTAIALGNAKLIAKYQNQSVSVDISTSARHNAYINGYPDGSFRPEAEITRAEVSAMLYKLSDGQQATKPADAHYSDLEQTHWAYEFINALSAEGVLNGYQDGSFRPEAPITRSEMAAMLVRSFDLPAATEAPFADVAGHWAQGAVGAAYQAEWVNGYPDSSFQPDAAITRAEAVTIVNRAFGRAAGINNFDTAKLPFNDVDASKWYAEQIAEAATGHTCILDHGKEAWIAD